VARTRQFQIDFQVPANGRLRRAEVQVLDGKGTVQFSDKADMMDAKAREQLVNRIASRLKAVKRQSSFPLGDN
jgi:hypothetical protein